MCKIKKSLSVELAMLASIGFKPLGFRCTLKLQRYYLLYIAKPNRLNLIDPYKS